MQLTSLHQTPDNTTQHSYTALRYTPTPHYATLLRYTPTLHSSAQSNTAFHMNRIGLNRVASHRIA